MSGAVRLDDARLRALRAELRPRAARIVAAIAHEVEAIAKVNVPRDPKRPPQDPSEKVTGALRNSIQAVEKGPLTWWVTVGQVYGKFQEFGTRHIPARPYLIPAVERLRSKFERRLAELFE